MFFVISPVVEERNGVQTFPLFARGGREIAEILSTDGVSIVGLREVNGGLGEEG